MVNKSENLLKEIGEIKQEIKALKRRVGGYKGWLTRYRKSKKKLREERDQVSAELTITKNQLLQSIQEGKKAKEDRDKAICELDEIIKKLEAYKKICQEVNKVHYLNGRHLVREAEKLLFEEDVLIKESQLDSRDSSQMFTDPASINRSLLDR